MKVGIITFHFVQNRGAQLQCFATQRLLEKMGHEAYVINYCPKYHVNRFATKKNPFAYASWAAKKRKPGVSFLSAWFERFNYAVKANRAKTDEGINTNAERFRKKHYHNLTRLYKTYNDLKNDPPKLDAYICGSDQLWNPKLLNFEYDPAYFCKFGDEKAKRFSYACSIGMAPETAHDKEELRRLCAGLDAVSIREYNKDVIDVIGRDVSICIDPTLNLDQEDFTPIEEDVPGLPEKYIFVYGFTLSDTYKKAILEAKEKYKCEVVNGMPKWLHLDFPCIELWDFNPSQFLTLIKNATCVVADSFHGNALSIVYKKNLIIVPREVNKERVLDLVTKLGLTSRVYSFDGFDADTPIDYDAVYEKLYELRKIAKNYIETNLEGKKD